MLFTACTVVGVAVAAHPARAQTTVTPTPSVIPGDGAASDLNAYQIKKIHILYQKLLLKEKDIPNAVSVVTTKDVEAENKTTGSIQTLLNKTPSVVAYTQGPGQSAPTLAIRGVRNDELAETLDGIPINDLQGNTGDYLTNNVGSPVTLNQIGGSTVYPGIAPPDHQGFGTVGGTIAYTTKQPTDDRSAELTGGFGSFDTQNYGFTLNTGKMGDGPDAAKALVQYDNSQTAGYIDNTKSKFQDFMLNIVKPYDNGLSKVGLVVLYNTGQGLVQTQPTPEALIQQYGAKYNFPTSEGFYNQAGQFLTTILSDETYINPHMIFDGSLFYLHNAQQIDSYDSVDNSENGAYLANIQTPYNFFGPVGPGTNFYQPGYFTYDPTAAFGSPGAGETDEYLTGHENTVGIDPKLNIFAGDHNTITIGGLLAKDSSSPLNQYWYGGDAAKENQIDGYNSATFGGGYQRSVYVAYIQDKITLLNDKLQILIGGKVDAAYSSHIQVETNGSYDPQKLQNFTKVGEPYVGIAYNLPDHFVAYGSFGKSSLFAPTSDYASGADSGIPGGTTAPTPELVRTYEGGIRYDTPRLYLNLDYYYQSIADGFAYFQNFVTDQEYYANTSGYLLRGLEAAAEYRVTPELSVYANGSVNRAIYTKSSFGFVTLQQEQFGYGFTGTPVSNTPQSTANVGVDYDSGPFSLRLAGQYTGQEYETYDLRAEPYGSPAVPPSPSNPTGTPAVAANPLNGATTTNTHVTNPPNFIVNLLLGYDLPIHLQHVQKVNVELNVQNLLGERYYVYQYSSEDPLNGYYSYTPEFSSGFIGSPRSISLQLTAKF
jgi:iron complex outermembrane receptor protein